MRTNLLLMMTAVLLVLVSGDFARRLGAFCSAGAASAPPTELFGGHEQTCDLVSYDGTTSTLEFRFVPDAGTKIADVQLERAELGGKLPAESLPRVATPDAMGVVVMRLVYQDVEWVAQAEPPCFRAFLQQVCLVRYVGSELADRQLVTSSLPFLVHEGPGFDALVRSRGAPR